MPTNISGVDKIVEKAKKAAIEPGYGVRISSREIFTLVAEIERMRQERSRYAEALERAITYIELSYDETDGEESAEAKRDLELARAALALATGKP